MRIVHREPGVDDVGAQQLEGLRIIAAVVYVVDTGVRAAQRRDYVPRVVGVLGRRPLEGVIGV